MKIFIEQVIDLPIQQVWQIFAVDFSDIQKWSNFVQTSAVKNDGELVDDASVVGRYCDTELGKLDETIKIFNTANHEIKFLVTSKDFPFFMRSINSHWRFYDENGNTKAKTEVELDLVFPFNIIMSIPLKRTFTKALNGVKSELETYAKTLVAS